MSYKDYAHITDAELLERFYATNDNKWIGILLQRYTLLLLGTCMKYLKDEEAAKDGVQQIFLKAITELHKYRVAYFKSWIYMVAKNYCLMQLRDKHVFVSAETQQELENPTDEIGGLLLKERNLQLMEASMEELNTEQRTCITLFYLQKKSYQDISTETGYSLMQVKSHIQNGKRNLKLLLEKKMHQANG